MSNKCPERYQDSAAKWKKEEKKKKNEVMNEILVGVQREAEAAGGTVAEKAVFVAQSADAREDPSNCVGRTTEVGLLPS